MTTRLEEVIKILEDEGAAPPDGVIRQYHRLDRDLNFDSLDSWTIIARIEEKYGVEIDDADVMPIETVGELVSLVEKALAEG